MKLRNLFSALALVLATLVFFFTLTGFRNATVLKGPEIMDRVKSTHASDTEVELIQMVIVDETGNTQQRKLLSVIKGSEDGHSSYLLRFLEPEQIKGVTLLTIEKGDNELEQYLYLPALGTPRKITGSARSGYFMGSDFTFEDLRKENPREHKYYRMIDDNVDGQDVYVVMSAPADVDVFNATGYEHRYLYIDKKTYDILRIEFYEEDANSPLKTFQGYDFEGKDVDGPAKRPGRVVMNHHEKGTTTIMTLLRSRLNVTVSDELFTEASLTDWDATREAQLLGIFEENK